MSEAFFYHSLNILSESDYRKLAKWKQEFGTWENAWRNTLRTGDTTKADKDWLALSDAGIDLILGDDQKFPPLLKEISHPPFALYLLGKLPPQDSTAIAIVGTRKATVEGKELARAFAERLARKGLIIVSGLALGIDACSHIGCLEAGGRTIAVLGNGLDYFYPKTNEKLAKKILEAGGAIISEYPPGTPALPYRFLERNRIVSGLSRGTLVIEAPENSGSLVTARFALDQNRDVFVIPGPISHPNFKGSHRLIRSGAELITSPEEILEDFGIAEEGAEKTGGTELETAEEKIIYGVLKKLSRPATVDKIVEITNLNISEANQTLTFLVIKNIIKETDAGYVLN